MTDDNRDLYESFAALRREEEARVPPISTLAQTDYKHDRRRLSGKLVAATMSLATVIAVAALLQVGHERSNRGPEQAAVSITSWKPSTDFLLNTPAHELLEGVPAVGEWHGVAIQPGPGESHRPHSKHVVP